MSGDEPTPFVPTPSRLSQPYWDGAARGVLRYARCTACGEISFPPQFACRQCLGTGFEWLDSRGRGTVYSFSVLHLSHDGQALAEPSVLADVDVDEGWHMLTSIVGCRPEEVAIGMAVQVRWRPVSPTISLPVFAPVAESTTG